MTGFLFARQNALNKTGVIFLTSNKNEQLRIIPHLHVQEVSNKRVRSSQNAFNSKYGGIEPCLNHAGQ